MQTLRAAMQEAREADGKQACRGMAGWLSTAEIAAIVCGGVTLSIEPMQTLRACGDAEGRAAGTSWPVG
ncbi:hypothetical protein CFB41_06410 [Burkholderia sp. AU33803]|nr:hypothetical protein CFB41_06410 [Burkholderia sp. AU33803]PRD86611.1 hypothetical protein C6P88_30985 [Burkholderia contaminans]